MLASLGVPYALEDYPDAAVRICTYSDVPVSQQALAEFLLARHVSARLGCELDRSVERGSCDRLKRLRIALLE